MLETLKNLKSYEVFKYFKEMNQIPRGSGNEKAISDWLVNFAKEHNLEVKQDDVLNVIIKKPGTKGYENSPTVVLQGHMDMVCEKEAGSNHDFTKDPIAFIVEGDTLRADGTTLGADNGIAVAIGLSILASEDISHPPLEVLITTEEETGMGGAQGLDPKDITGRMLINIDSEEEGKLLVSCSGGVREIISLPIERKDMENGKGVYKIVVGGLQGGHSGMEINKERGNSNKIIGRILNDLSENMDFNIASINGGAKMNAIPRDAEAIIVLDEKHSETLENKISEWNKILSVELNAQDPNVKVSLEKAEWTNKIFTCDTTEKVIQMLMLIPNGVQGMSMAIKGLVESSTNLGVVVIKDEVVEFESCIRSSVQTLKEDIVRRGKVIAKLLGAKIEFIADYPAWEYNPNSKLREKFIEIYKELHDREPEIDAIHAGLECGLFGGKFNGEMDMISLGPDMFDVHTPKESVNIPSTERVYEYILKVLENLK